MNKTSKVLIPCLLTTMIINPIFNFTTTLGYNNISLNYSVGIKNAKSSITGIFNKQRKMPDKVIMNVPLIAQLPEFKNGCEVTSLAMLINYTGAKIDKNSLAKEVKMDTTPMITDSSGEIIKWGDPDDGFVGSLDGEHSPGYSINPNPLLPLANKYLNNKANDLSGKDIDTLIKYLSLKKPVLVWVTSDFSISDNFITWTKNKKQIKATFDEHCVVLTGYDKNNFYYNDPLNVGKNKVIDKETFKKCWNSMGSLALSYK